jgi:hypothetical protein
MKPADKEQESGLCAVCEKSSAPEVLLPLLYSQKFIGYSLTKVSGKVRGMPAGTFYGKAGNLKRWGKQKYVGIGEYVFPQTVINCQKISKKGLSYVEIHI